MRTKKSLINIIYNVIFSVITIVLGFISRTIFLSIFGAEYLGLTQVVINLISVISIMELGVAAAIGYALYQHLSDENYRKINELIKFIKISYSIVGLAVLVIGIGLSFFVPNIVKTNNISLTIIYLTYFLQLSVTVISYFLTYKQVLITADQKSYIITKISGTMKIIKTILQIVSIIVWENFIIWVALEVVFSLFIYILINKTINKNYQWLNVKIEKTYKQLIKENKSVLINLKNIMYHRLATVILQQTDSIIISLIINLRNVGIYSNYIMIYNQLLMLIGQVFYGFTASVGNLIAGKDDKHSYAIFKQLYVLEFFIGVCISYTLYKTINPFISLWVGDEYLLNSSFVLILALNFFLSTTRQIINSFKSGYGIFNDIYAPVVEGFLNISISIYLGNKFGLVGILFGTFSSLLIIIVFWQPYLVFKRGFKESIIKYVKQYILQLSVGLVSILIVEVISNLFSFKPSRSILEFGFYGIYILFSICTVYFCSLLLVSDPFRRVVKRVFMMLKLKISGDN